MNQTVVAGPDAAGRVLVADGHRVVSFDRQPGDLPTDALRLDAEGAGIEPGAINAHTHIYSALAPLGMPAPEPPPEDFLQILERVWWRLDRALDEETLRASARLYAAEALLAGTTTLIDHHESPCWIDGSLDILADACQEIGIRALLTYGASERNGGRGEAHRGLAESRRFLRDNRRPLVRGVIGLHASFTVSDEVVREAGELCRELGTVLHTHLAEDGCDVIDAQHRGYTGPLERLLTLEALPPGSILAHGVHLNADQVRAAAEGGLWLVQNPRSNRGNRVGYPIALACSSRVALGTDGYPAQMADEAETLFEQAAAHGDDQASAERRLTAGHQLAAERFEREFAPLEPGAAADVVVKGNGEVRHVLVDGRVVVKDGRLLTADLEAVRAEARDQARRLWQRLPVS